MGHSKMYKKDHHGGGHCTECGASTSESDEEKSLPLVQVFGRVNCGFATKAHQLIKRELVRPDGPRIDETSSYTVISRSELVDMDPPYMYCPRVYVDGGFIGGYEQLSQFIGSLQTHDVVPPQRPSQNVPETVIQQFIQSESTRDGKLFLAITADWCPPCIQLKKAAHWYESDAPGHHTYHEDTSTALCFTLGEHESMASDILNITGIRMGGYPTVLEYSRIDQTWEKVHPGVLSKE